MTTAHALPRLLVIVGPTASGKTQAGISVARELYGAVTSADSRQVYAGMNIGTAKPLDSYRSKPHDDVTPEVVDVIRHYLLNISTPDKPLSVSSWQRAARRSIETIVADKLLPILVGGTMLYLDSIIRGYELPPVAPDLKLRRKLEQHATEKLYAELLQKDPNASEFIEPHNKRRIIRALEVILETGQPFSKLRRTTAPSFSTQVVGIAPDWQVLGQRINDRVEKMLADELIEETRKLLETYGPLPLLETLNYAQAQAVLNGRLTLAQARAEMIRANLRYARRQMSWWKGRSDIAWRRTPEELTKYVTSFYS